MIEFVVPAVPIAQPRPQAAVIAGRAVVRSASRNHPVQDFKATTRLTASSVYDGPPLDGPLTVRCMCVFPRTQAEMFKKREMRRMWRPRKPDVDNLVKSVLDALNGLLWRDDSQICQLLVGKITAAGDEQPHVHISVDALGLSPASQVAEALALDGADV